MENFFSQIDLNSYSFIITVVKEGLGAIYDYNNINSIMAASSYFALSFLPMVLNYFIAVCPPMAYACFYFSFT